MKPILVSIRSICSVSRVMTKSRRIAASLACGMLVAGLYAALSISAHAPLVNEAHAAEAAPAASAAGDKADTRPDIVKRGEYLARAGDCVACHTAPRGKLFGGGLAMETPFGTLYSPNISPDAQYGIGTWSE
jgi:mono/diheme cytochrome c family protein